MVQLFADLQRPLVRGKGLVHPALRRLQITDVPEGGGLGQKVLLLLGGIQGCAVRRQRLIDAALLLVHDAQAQLKGHREAVPAAFRHQFQPATKMPLGRRKLAQVERHQTGIEEGGKRHIHLQ